MKPRLLLAGALLCLGCSAEAPPDPLPPVQIGVRNPTKPIASQTDASLSRLQGTWRVVQAAGMTPGAVLVFATNAVAIGPVQMAVTDLGRGRLQLGETQFWVLWLDADNRTAVLGDPDGRRVWIMDRTGAPGERLTAARDILEWYGYDLTRLAP